LGAVEYADVAAARHRDHRAPHEVVRQFLLARPLERMHVAALRVDPGHHVGDRAVLAARVHRLKNHQQRPAVLGVEQLLQLGEPLDVFGEDVLRLRLADVEAAGVAGIDVREVESLGALDAVVLDVLRDLHGLPQDRKSTRLNSSHVKISYAVFCLKKKKKKKTGHTAATTQII